MAKKETKIQVAQKETQLALDRVNRKIEELGNLANKFFIEIGIFQEMLDNISSIPNDRHVALENSKAVRSTWKDQASKIEKDYEDAYIKDAGIGAAGIGLGAGVVALGPAAAMGVATTFGVASTGTAIAALHGVAATNAALAWLGGGALAAGGGGIIAGQALLSLAGPVGWAIAGIAFASSGIALLANRTNKTNMENIFVLVSKRDVKSYNLATLELKERIKRIEQESQLIHEAIARLQTFGIDYNAMPDPQQYELGSYVNLVNSATHLLTDPIIGLQPKFTEDDYTDYYEFVRSNLDEKCDTSFYEDNKTVIISLCNLLYMIGLSKKENKTLWETFRNNAEVLKSLGKKKKELPLKVFDEAQRALKYKYIKQEQAFS
ncbi:MAG: hypothetical protein K6E41_09545 [Solobacterium sp.]|nr:hypothetical protein [Solobacterium sp.]